MLVPPVPTQTTEHFRDRYHRIYSVNGGSDAADEEEDDNLVVRSFTDDPEIPLTQIRVSIQCMYCTCTCTGMTILTTSIFNLNLKFLNMDRDF